jgi:hypothetical protein
MTDTNISLPPITAQAFSAGLITFYSLNELDLMRVHKSTFPFVYLSVPRD